MRLFLLVSLFSVCAPACSPLEVIELGGDAGRSNNDASASTGTQGPLPASASSSSDASAGEVPSTNPSSAPYPPVDAGSLVCTLSDASYPVVDGGDPAYSVPLPGTGSPASAADGWIFFDSDVDADSPDLYAIHPDGSGLTLLGGGGSEPTISPDGNTLAYTGLVAGIPQVFARRLPGTDTTQLTSMGGGASQAAFSPDGKLVAFHSGNSIYLVNADGTSVRPVILSSDPMYPTIYEHPTFGPDGKTLIVDGGNEIDVFDLTGQMQRYVVANYTTEESAPAISRDGVTVAFVLGACTGANPQISLTLLGGTLANPCAACPASQPNLGNPSHPSWGPRSLLTFSHASNTGVKRIVVVDTANPNAEPVEILQDQGNQRNPTWAPSTFNL